jgi:hypothetical protein
MGKAIRCGMPVFASSIMYRREARTLLHADYTVYDWYFLTDILKHGDSGYIAEPLGMYRTHQSSAVGQAGYSLIDAFTELYSRRLKENAKSKGRLLRICTSLCLRDRSEWRDDLQTALGPSAIVLHAPGDRPLIDAVKWSLLNGKALAR